MGIGTGRCVIPTVTSRHKKVLQTQAGQIRIDGTVYRDSITGKTPC